MPRASVTRFLCCCITMRVAFGTVTFHSGVLDGVTLYSPSVTSFIGPQPGDSDDPITGAVVVYNDDLCDPNGAASTTMVSGLIVLASTDAVTSASCSQETIYLNMVSRGAAGILCRSNPMTLMCGRLPLMCVPRVSVPGMLAVPGMLMFYQDGSRGARTRFSHTMCLRIQPTEVEYHAALAMAPHLNATIFPDPNVWGTMYASLPYQIFVRILPGLTLIVSGLLAMAFLVQHTAIMNDRYNEAVVASRRTGRRRLQFFLSIVDLPYAALVLETITATLAGAFLIVSGYSSNATLPASVVGFFTTLLTGWGMDCSLVSARLWAKKLADITPGRRPSLITRIVEGDFWIASVFLYLVPVVFDTLFSVCLATNIHSPGILASGPSITILLQLIISSNVIVGVVRYYRTVSGIHHNVRNAVERDASVDRLMIRLSRCALGLAISMLLSCSGSLMLGAAPRYAYTPNGYFVAATLFCTGRALDSAFRVLMFQPRRRDIHLQGRGTQPPPTLVASAKKKTTVFDQQQ